MPNQFTRDSIISIRLTGEYDKAICNHCNEELKLPFPFTPYKTDLGNGKKFLVKSRIHLLLMFQEKHFGKYMLSLPKEKR